MPRAIPDVPKDWKPPQPASGRSYEIELITPMFGGGAIAKAIDPKFAIRPSSIRGQLQFWWRATVGAQYETKERLREEQSKIWGDTTQASRVQIRIMKLQTANPVACAVIKPNHNGKEQVFWKPPFCQEWKNKYGEHDPKPVTYALFPFHGKQTNKEGPKVEPSSCIHNASFTLTIICDKSINFEKDIEPALWAWVNFGGLGSRTRRGCGALYCEDFAPENLDSISTWYRNHVPATSPRIRDWPTMPAQFLHYPQPAKPLEQWNRVIGLLRDFRQKAGSTPGHPRPPGPDRSWYPEPDTIRRITRTHSEGHDPSLHLSGGEPLPDGFPRAEFGLPIVFKFLDDKSGDPKRTTLQPYVGGQETDKGTPDSPDVHVTGGEIAERMASPLVLRPLALSRDVAVAIILHLKTPGVSHVTLVGDNGTDLTPRHAVPVRDAEFGAYPDSPIRTLTSAGSALQAFLNLALQKAGTITAHPNTGFQEVPRS